MRVLTIVLVSALVVALAAHPAGGATAGGDPTEPGSRATEVARLEREVDRARTARNAALLEGAATDSLDLADAALWIVAAADALGLTLSETDAEQLLATAALERGGAAAAEQALVEDARRRLGEATAGMEEFIAVPAGAERRLATGPERWRDLVARYFPERIIDEAMSIMECESGGDPTARNRRSGATGLFQFLRGTWQFAAEAAGVGHLPPTDPEANIAAAAWLVRDSEAQGYRRWAHWTCRP